MTTAGPIDTPSASTATEPAVEAAPGAGVHSRRRRVGTLVAFGIAVLLLWEAVKWLGGVPWRFKDVLGTGLVIDHSPPFRFPFATDLNLPHWFNILGALAAPVQRNAQQSLGEFLVGAALLHLARGGHRVRGRRPARAGPGDRCSSTRGCSSGRSCRT